MGHAVEKLRHYATSRKVAGSSPDEVDFFFNLSNPSSRIMTQGSTQPLTEMSIRNLPGGKGRPARKADNLTAICEPVVKKMWEPRHLTTLWDFTACYRDSVPNMHWKYLYPGSILLLQIVLQRGTDPRLELLKVRIYEPANVAHSSATTTSISILILYCHLRLRIPNTN
jgi:hypothetical protein